MNLDSAKAVAFHPQVMTNTITLDGDHFDPEGILTGGSRGERSNLLVKINELKENSSEINLKRKDLTKLELEISQEREKSISFSRLKNEFDLQLNQLNLAKISLEQTTHHQKLEKSNSLAQEVISQKEEIENSTKELESLNTKLKDLEYRVKNQGSNDIEEEKSKAQKKIQEAKQSFEKKQQNSSQLQQVVATFNLHVVLHWFMCIFKHHKIGL